jgi:4'-phosphopantetheinyl transferase
MLYYEKRKKKGTLMSYAKTYYTNFSDFYTEEAINARISEISAAKKERIETAKRAETKASLLAGELLIRAALKASHGLENVEIAVDEHGKPYLPQHPDVHFNLSHSGNIAVCTVSDVPCGVDIEQISKPHEVMAMANRFLSMKEHAAVLMSPNPNEAFCRLWTLRESYVKMRGLGFEIGLSTLKCDFHRGICSIYEKNALQEDAKFHEWKTVPDFRISVCTKGDAEHTIEKLPTV